MKLERIRSEPVEFMPKQLEPGILYISQKYGTAAHLCACGCGEKIRTPLGQTEWSVTDTATGPSLWPSVGNWQKACQSHYVVKAGRIVWCGKWTPEEILAGRHAEEERREAYYREMYAKKPNMLGRAWRWLKSLFGG
jgi:hypothetical protein